MFQPMGGGGMGQVTVNPPFSLADGVTLPPPSSSSSTLSLSLSLPLYTTRFHCCQVVENLEKYLKIWAAKN